jgi:hypothetical protein
MDVVILSVHGDAVYWVHPADTPCELAGDRECLRYQWVVRYDVATDSTARVPWAQYDEDLRTRPRTIMGPDRGTPPVPGTFPLDGPLFGRQGTDLIARAYDGARELTLKSASTGDPIRLQLVPADTQATLFEFSQWLDDDRLVLFGYTENNSEYADVGDIYICELSTGNCRHEPPAQAGPVQLPALD